MGLSLRCPGQLDRVGGGLGYMHKFLSLRLFCASVCALHHLPAASIIRLFHAPLIFPRLQVSTKVPGNNDQVLVLLGYLRRQAGQQTNVYSYVLLMWRYLRPGISVAWVGRAAPAGQPFCTTLHEPLTCSFILGFLAPRTTSPQTFLCFCSYTGMGVARVTCASSCFFCLRNDFATCLPMPAATLEWALLVLRVPPAAAASPPGPMASGTRPPRSRKCTHSR